MKPPLSALRVPYGAGHDLLRTYQLRAASERGTRNAARFSVSVTRRAQNQSITQYAPRSTQKKNVGRARRSHSTSNAPTKQSSSLRNALAEPTHQLSSSLGSEGHSSLSDPPRQQRLLQDTAWKTQQSSLKPERHLKQEEKEIEQGNLAKELRLDVPRTVPPNPRAKVAGFTAKAQSQEGYESAWVSKKHELVRSRADNEPIATFPQGQEELPQNSDIEAQENIVISDQAAKPIQDRPSKHQRYRGIKRAAASESTRVPGHLFATRPATQQLGLKERRSVLQLATHLNEVLAYAAVEKHAEAQKPRQEVWEEQFDTTDDAQTSTVSFSMTTNSPLSHMSILAAYIDLEIRKSFLSQADYDFLLTQLFNDQILAYLDDTHYDVDDVVAWAWILNNESNHDAAIRLMLWSNRPMPAPRVPRFVWHILLERNITEAGVIQLLTDHLWHRLTNRVDKSWETLYKTFVRMTMSPTEKSMQAETIEAANYRMFDSWSDSERLNISIFRLLKMAVWSVPALLPNLATMLCEHISVRQSVSSTRDDGLSFASTQSLTQRFNQALAKIASRTSEPFTAVPYQERAQFIIVRRMSEFRPPLILGREAYQAVVSIQLRHRKTNKERVWAELKSRAWPPYKEDKTGLDATKKSEVYGISRAQQGLRNLKEAGFVHKEWENSASVLSGWDVDGSPTIQTRRILPLPAKPKSNKKDETHKQPILWESRVFSTRTIQEAWAVFLNYVEEETSPTPNVFLAMFEKISQERIRKTKEDSGRDSSSYTILAGDMPETLPASPNPRDQVYTPSPPPTFDQFYQRYLDHFHTLDDRALAFLLPNAETLEHAVRYVQDSSLSPEEKDILLRHKVSNDKESLSLSSAVFTAYIHMLSNFATTALPNHNHVTGLKHAVHLVQTARPFYRGPWLYTLRAMEIWLSRSTRKVLWQRHWDTVTEIAKRMHSAGVRQDSDSFYSICTMLSHLLYFAFKVEDNRDDFFIRMDSSSNVLVQGTKLIKKLFIDLVFDSKSVLGLQKTKATSRLPGGAHATAFTTGFKLSDDNLAPRLLYVPSPAALHRFIRLLGALKDKQGVIGLIEWMSYFDPELQIKVSGLSAGPRHFRWILVAARIISETESTPFMSGMGLRHLDSMDSEHAQKLKSIVEAKESWGGWPTDDEVQGYLDYGVSNNIQSTF